MDLNGGRIWVDFGAEGCREVIEFIQLGYADDYNKQKSYKKKYYKDGGGGGAAAKTSEHYQRWELDGLFIIDKKGYQKMNEKIKEIKEICARNRIKKINE